MAQFMEVCDVWRVALGVVWKRCYEGNGTPCDLAYEGVKECVLWRCVKYEV